MIYQTPGLNITAPVILMENGLIGSTVPTSSPTASGDRLNLLTDTTYDGWQSSAVGGLVYMRPPAAVTVDTFALIGHNVADTGGTLLFGYRAEITDADTWVPLNIKPADNGPLVLLTTPITAKQFVFNVYTGATSGVMAAIFWAGRRLVLPSSVAPDYVRAPDAVTVDGEAAVSRGGQYLGTTIRRKAGKLSPQFNPIARVWADANLPAFRKHYDERRPFIFASSPAVYPDDVVYGWRGDGAGELRPTIGGGGAYVRFGMELDFHAA